MDKIVIYTDGSCLSNPGPGGWAVLLMYGKKEEILKGGESDTTNNRMEMTAILNALKWLNKNVKTSETKIELFSDSNLLIQSLTKGWKRKANLDIWKQIDREYSLLNKKNIKVGWNWVKGHSVNEYNALVDETAVSESRKQPRKSLETKPAKTSSDYYCGHCKKNVKGILSFMPDSQMIRVDCEKCGKYIKFGQKTTKNLILAKKKILISKKQQTTLF
jgi:ribonuclease HI